MVLHFIMNFFREYKKQTDLQKDFISDQGLQSY